jgi:hypothetical protein
MNSQIILIFNF